MVRPARGLHGISFIVAEPKRVTDAFFVAPQPGRTDIRRFAEKGFRTIINNRPDGEEPGQLSAAEAKAEAEQANLTYDVRPHPGKNGRHRGERRRGIPASVA